MKEQTKFRYELVGVVGQENFTQYDSAYINGQIYGPVQAENPRKTAMWFKNLADIPVGTELFIKVPE